MAKLIIWTLKAKSRYESIVRYIASEWGESVALNFMENVAHTTILISRFPRLGRVSSKSKNTRSIPVSKHNRLLYKSTRSGIIILFVVDTRMRKRQV